MRVLIQYDGSNFYNKVKKLCPSSHLTYFNYFGFSQKISSESLPQVIYYVGEVTQHPSNKKSQSLYKSQQMLFYHLKKQAIIVKKGYLLKSKGIYHEKGVDVRIAIDMAVGAVRNEYDICYLISSDTDLLPAVETAKKAGKKIVYVAFKNLVSNILKNNCDECQILDEFNLLSFFPQ